MSACCASERLGGPSGGSEAEAAALDEGNGGALSGGARGERALGQA